VGSLTSLVQPKSHPAILTPANRTFAREVEMKRADAKRGARVV